ncbi:MAG: prolyl oligopeptidase family serine peptidase [Rhizomicrobium sp.]
MRLSSAIRQCVLLVAAAVFSCVANAADTPAPPHPLDIEDMLAMERFGQVGIGGGGRLVLFEKGGPKEGFSDYGIDDQAASSRIYVFDRTLGTVKRLLEGFAFPNWIGAVSPGGGKLAIYWLDDDHVKAGVVDLGSGKLTPFAFTPAYDFEVGAPLWISDTELVYATDTDGAYSPRIDFRRRAALIESAGQQTAWHGGVSASVLENHPTGFLPEWRPGTLLRVDADSGKAAVLAQGRYVEPSLSPDKRYLAVGRQGRYLPFAPDSGKETYDPHRLEPFLIDLQHGRAAVAMCQGCQLSGRADFAWGPAGHRVSFFARFGQEPWEHVRFRVFDADTKALAEIRHVGLDLASQRETTGAASAPVKAIPFGPGALVPARKQTDPKAAPIFTFKEPTTLLRVNMDRKDLKAKLGRLDWYVVTPDGVSHPLTGALDDVQPNLAAEDSHGLYFMGGGKILRLDFNGTVHDIAALAGQGVLYKLDGAIDEGGHAVAVSVGPDGSRIVQFFDGRTSQLSVKAPATIGIPMAVDPTSGVVAFQSDGPQGSTLSVLDRDGRIAPILSINGHLRQVAPAKQVMLKYTLPSGEVEQACLLLPANAVPGKKLPTIVSVYPVEGRCRSLWHYGLANTYDDELFTGMGYAVLNPATPARLLQEGDNPTAHWGALVEAAVNEAVRGGYVDKDRLGLWGMSLGGHSALSTLSQTHIFKAGVAANGAADFFSNYASLGIVRSLLSDDLFAVGHAAMYEGAPDEGLHIGATPWERPDAYAAASPLSHAGTMNTPLLLFAGELDWDYQMTEFDQYYVALVRQGKEVTYVRYLGEGHGNFSPANVRDAWRRMRLWFDAHLR